MKWKYLISFICLIFLKTGFTQTDINAGISVGSEGIKSFYFSISDYFRVPEQQVEIIRERKISDEELPVVFYVAGLTGEKPEVIVDVRVGGSSWYDISMKYGINASIFYVPIESNPGPPYGKAYGYYKNKPKKEWKNIILTDEDIINLTNLRFISEYYNYDPDKVMKMRGEGKNFVVINNSVKANKSSSKNMGEGKNQTDKNK